jgi:hypothetical protein
LFALTSGSLPACFEMVTVTSDVGAAASFTLNDAVPPSGRASASLSTTIAWAGVVGVEV